MAFCYTFRLRYRQKQRLKINVKCWTFFSLYLHVSEIYPTFATVNKEVGT